MAADTLYDLHRDAIDYSVVRRFVLDAEAANLLTESMTFELKEKRSGRNVVEAVAALSNTDGGLVLLGVKEDATGEDRLVGVPQSEHDALVGQMRDAIPAALPEVIPVALPNGDRLIIVLRVNADAVMHPVVVAGKVLYRVPGASVPADRQRVLDLAARDSGSGRETGATGHALAIPSDFPLWPESDGSVATVRVCGGLRLPHRIIYSPWLTSAARLAATGALHESPLPDRFWGSAPHVIGGEVPEQWRVTEARSRTLKLRTPSVGSGTGGTVTTLTAGDVPVQGSAFIQLAGRDLSMMVGLRWFPAGAAVPPMAIEHLYSALLAGLLAVSSTCVAIAAALDAAEPTELALWEAWLQPHAELRTSDVLGTRTLPKDGDQDPQGGYFERSRTVSASVESLDALARNWVTVLLLDMGLKEFETALAEMPIPVWATSPR